MAKTKKTGRNLPRRMELKKKRNDDKRKRREDREKKRNELGAAAPPKEKPRTIENTRELNDNYIKGEDEEIIHDEMHDSMSNYFTPGAKPKILITTSPGAKVKAFKLCFELRRCIPNSEVYARKNVAMKRIVKDAKAKDFTDIVVVHEDHKIPNGIVICHLPDGPTAYFKINSLKFTKQIKGAGDSTSHFPEIMLNNFKTRLGHSVARMFACLFPYDPQFTGRRVVTFHNQRDYIFFRHHRYEFKKEGEKAALHELGPRFTLRMKWLQKGTFDSRDGEYEWVLKRHEMETSRRKFFL